MGGWQYKMTTQVIVPLPQHRQDNRSAGAGTCSLYAVLQTRSHPLLLRECVAMCQVDIAKGYTRSFSRSMTFSLKTCIWNT